MHEEMKRIGELELLLLFCVCVCGGSAVADGIKKRLLLSK